MNIYDPRQIGGPTYMDAGGDRFAVRIIEKQRTTSYKNKKTRTHATACRVITTTQKKKSRP